MLVHLLRCLQMCLCLLHVVVRLLQVLFNAVEHFALLLNQHGKLLEKLKKFIDRLLQLQDGLVFSLNVVYCVFNFGMSGLAHNLLLH